MLRDNKGLLSSASLPHYSNLISRAAAQEAAQCSHSTVKASCMEKTAEDECAAPLGRQITCFTASNSEQSSLSGYQQPEN